MTSELYPQQAAVLRQILSLGIERNRPVVLCGGQRAGKSVMLRKLVEMRHSKIVFISGSAYQSLETLQLTPAECRKRDILWLGPHLKPDKLVARIDASWLVIVDDVFWLPDYVWKSIDAVREIGCPVVAASSRGKGDFPLDYEEFVWNYATWELNPLTSKKVVFEVFSGDLRLVKRDCGHMSTWAWLKARLGHYWRECQLI